MSKVSNKDIRTTPLMSFCCFYCYLWTFFTPCSSISVVRFVQVNAGRVNVLTRLINLEAQENSCKNQKQPFADVLQNNCSFAVFTGKHQCWSLFLTKLQAKRRATLLKGHSNTDSFSWEYFKNGFLIEYSTSCGCFWKKRVPRNKWDKTKKLEN